MNPEVLFMWQKRPFSEEFKSRLNTIGDLQPSKHYFFPKALKTSSRKKSPPKNSIIALVNAP